MATDGPQPAVDEALLDVLLGLRRQAGVKVVRRHALLLQELGHLLGVPARGAVDDGSTRHIIRQVLPQQSVDVVELGRAAGGHHHELQVGAPGPVVEDLQLDAQLLPEILYDLGLHVGLGGGGEAQHLRRLIIAGPLPDEAPHVAVVGPEVVPPLGQAVGLVHYPTSDLPLVQHPPQGHAAQLLR